MNTSAFWEHVDRTAGPDACWPWTGAHINNGYGQLRVGRQRILAHRLAYTLNVGDIPAGLCVLHTCDNRTCVNPAHLFLGTDGDNIRDAIAKGRLNRARLAPDRLRQVRSLHAAGLTNREIVNTTGLSYKVVHCLTSGRTYREATA